jgi:hypothetical protein
LEESSKYFEILFSIFKNKNKNNNSLIYLKLTEFISSFKDMIVKLKNSGIDSKSNPILKDIEYNINNKNSLITPPIKIEPIKNREMNRKTKK